MPLPLAASDDEQFRMLQSWLASYKPTTLFDKSNAAHSVILPKVTSILPKDDLKLGLIKESWRGFEPLDLPDSWKSFASEKDEEISPMKATAIYLEEVIKRNPKR